jgi:hypothetical protein
MRAHNPPPVSPFCYTVKQCVAMGFGCRQTIDDKIQRGDLDAFKEGRSKKITAESVERYKAKLLAAARHPDSTAPKPSHRRSRKQATSRPATAEVAR